jgi:hypothetical protein
VRSPTMWRLPVWPSARRAAVTRPVRAAATRQFGRTTSRRRGMWRRRRKGRRGLC